ncbi:20134_t:CDS:2, partial [Racocetra persica]
NKLYIKNDDYDDNDYFNIEPNFLPDNNDTLITLHNNRNNRHNQIQVEECVNCKYRGYISLCNRTRISQALRPSLHVNRSTLSSSGQAFSELKSDNKNDEQEE